MLDDAGKLFKIGSYKSSNNRSYYAIFHAVRALFALESIDFKRHSGVIRHFQKEYVKTGIFDVFYSKILVNASRIREVSDYDDHYITSKTEAQKQSEDANKFFDKVAEYIESNTK